LRRAFPFKPYLRTQPPRSELNHHQSKTLVVVPGGGTPSQLAPRSHHVPCPMSESTEVQKRFRCRHILTSGRACKSPALRNEQFCCYHHATRRPAPALGKFRHLNAAEPFILPVVEDRASALLVASLILSRIPSNDLDYIRRAAHPQNHCGCPIHAVLSHEWGSRQPTTSAI